MNASDASSDPSSAPPTRGHRRLLLLFALYFALVLVMAIAKGPGRTTDPFRQMKDASQLRAVHQSMLRWATNDGQP